MELVEKVRAVGNGAKFSSCHVYSSVESNWWDKQSGVEYPPVCVVQRCDSGSTDHLILLALQLDIIGRRRSDTYIHCEGCLCV